VNGKHKSVAREYIIEFHPQSLKKNRRGITAAAIVSLFAWLSGPETGR
jgi:hypothetical protein